MEEFYTQLWTNGLRPREALERAKAKLGNDQMPVKAWAGFILTGDLKD